jgi:hypothetical protein
MTANTQICGMSRVSVNQEQLEDLPGRPPSGAAAADVVVADQLVSQPLSVRETQRLYRLKAARFFAVVAADTEDEARTLAARHDGLRGDWRNPEFASSEFEDTGEAHVFGDVAISAHRPSKRVEES